MFPVLHGPFGEDGTVQGLLECLDVPYVGAGVLASALCMDKVVFKELMAHAGIPQVEYRAVDSAEFCADPDEVLARAGDARPAGVRQAGAARLLGRDRARWRAPSRSWRPRSRTRSTTTRWRSSRRRAPGVEVECSVIGNDEPIASEPGEILLAAGERGWYDYEAKYTPGGMRLVVPARIPAAAESASASSRVRAFLRSGCSGLARVDFFIVGERVLLNELNTMPGFTRPACSGRCLRPAGCPTPSCSTGWSSSRSSATRHRAR